MKALLSHHLQPYEMLASFHHLALEPLLKHSQATCLVLDLSWSNLSRAVDTSTIRAVHANNGQLWFFHIFRYNYGYSQTLHIERG